MRRQRVILFCPGLGFLAMALAHISSWKIPSFTLEVLLGEMISGQLGII